jgi:hypothetical protein
MESYRESFEAKCRENTKLRAQSESKGITPERIPDTLSPGLTKSIHFSFDVIENGSTSTQEKLESRLASIRSRIPMHKDKLLSEFNSLYLSLIQASESFSIEKLENMILEKKHEFLELNSASVLEIMQVTAKSFGYEVAVSFDDDLVIV